MGDGGRGGDNRAQRFSCQTTKKCPLISIDYFMVLGKMSKTPNLEEKKTPSIDKMPSQTLLECGNGHPTSKHCWRNPLLHFKKWKYTPPLSAVQLSFDEASSQQEGSRINFTAETSASCPKKMKPCLAKQKRMLQQPIAYHEKEPVDSTISLSSRVAFDTLPTRGHPDKITGLKHMPLIRFLVGGETDKESESRF